MIGLVLGTTEGREILAELNRVTDDIFISASSKYGASVYESYSYREVNSGALDMEGFKKAIRDNYISLFIDSSHPFAVEVSKNLRTACDECGIRYFRYDRPGVYERYKDSELVTGVSDYEDIRKAVKGLEGTILNTTGSRNIERIIRLGMPNRIVHRVLPVSDVIKKISEAGVRVEDIVAMKMESGIRDINDALIKVYDVKAIITKDSGTAGGTVEKIEAALANRIQSIVILKKQEKGETVFNDIALMMDVIFQEIES